MSDASSRPPRASVILYAAVSRGEAAPVECRVRNLSTSGACIDDQASLEPGESVRVAMGTLRPLTAEVMWVARGFAGLQFDRAIDIAAARQPRSRAVAASGAGWLGGMSNPYRRKA